MQVHTESKSDTELELTVQAGPEDLQPLKEHVLKQLSSRVKVAGFREGKAPLSLIEKNVDQAVLQSEFVEEAVNHLYSAVIDKQGIRPVERPRVQVTKFIPFSELEFKAEVAVIGNIKLATYQKLKRTKPKVVLTAKDINEVVEALLRRAATRNEVDRAAKNGDEVVIDFTGADKAGKPINGADGKDYPLLLGSKSFIPGFEENLVGTKPGEQKSFTITFPKDYGVSALQNKPVTFAVEVKKVQELDIPKLDDAFAAKVSPFKTVTELKADIKKQLTEERQTEADRDFENQLVNDIVTKSTVTAPEVLISEQVEVLMRELQQNLLYRGQTFQEFLAQEGTTEEEYRQNVLRPQAELRVKAGLVLSEIAEKEGLTVTPEELEVRMQILKGQYKDPAMQAELDKPEARRDIASRILTEKTVEKLVSYATK